MLGSKLLIIAPIRFLRHGKPSVWDHIYQRWSRGHKARGQGQGHKRKSKAKDSLSEDRPSRGQGQECSRPRPRTYALVFSKKSLQKSFSGDLQFIGLPRTFDWSKPKPQIKWNNAIKIFPKRKFLWDKDIVGWKIWNRCLLARNKDFAKGEGLN